MSSLPTLLSSEEFVFLMEEIRLYHQVDDQIARIVCHGVNWAEIADREREKEGQV